MTKSQISVTLELYPDLKWEIASDLRKVKISPGESLLSLLKLCQTKFGLSCEPQHIRIQVGRHGKALTDLTMTLELAGITDGVTVFVCAKNKENEDGLKPEPKLSESKKGRFGKKGSKKDRKKKAKGGRKSSSSSSSCSPDASRRRTSRTKTSSGFAASPSVTKGKNSFHVGDYDDCDKEDDEEEAESEEREENRQYGALPPPEPAKAETPFGGRSPFDSPPNRSKHTRPIVPILPHAGILPLPGTGQFDRVDTLGESGTDSEAGEESLLLSPTSAATLTHNEVAAIEPQLGTQSSTNPERSLVYFSAFAPKSIRPGTGFLLNIWAFCKSQRAKVIKIEAAAGKSEAGIKGPLRIFIGDQIVIELVLPEVFEFEPEESSNSMEWLGEATNATFAVTCKRDAQPGQFACKASIFVLDSDNNKEKRGVLLFQLNVKKKWKIGSIFGFGRNKKQSRNSSRSSSGDDRSRSFSQNLGSKDGDLSATLTILPRNASPHIFISYRRMHKDLGQLIRVGLERYGYDCFLDINPNNGLGAGDFQKQLEKAMGTAKVVIPLLTPAPSGPEGTKRFGMTSMECLKDAIANKETDFCQFELEWALSDPNKIVLPLYRDIKTSDLGKELSGLPGVLSKLSSIGAFAFHDDMVDACILRTHNQIQIALAMLEKNTVAAE